MSPGAVSVRRHAGIRFLGLGLLLVCALITGVILGPADIAIRDILAILTGQDAPRLAQVIVTEVRLPRTITACLAGAALGVTGLQMQTLFRNPLADPYILGISSGASLGVGIVVLALGASPAAASLMAGLGQGGQVSITLAASIGSATVMIIVLALGRFISSGVTLLLIGVMIGYLTSASLSVMMSGASPQLIATFARWQFGSFNSTTWGSLGLFAPLLATFLVISWVQSKPLNALLLGDRYAQTLGLELRRTRTMVIITAAVMTGTVTACCGPVQFLGMAVPHLARGLFKTANHRVLLPGCALIGAIFALIADILAGLPGDGVLPLNAVTALLGAPIVIWILLRRRGLGV